MSKLQGKDQEKCNKQFTQSEACKSEKEFRDEIVRTIAELYDENEDFVRDYIYDDSIEKIVDEELSKEYNMNLGEDWSIGLECLPFGPTEIDLSVSFFPQRKKIFLIVAFHVKPGKEEEMVDSYEETTDARVLRVDTVDEGLLIFSNEIRCKDCFKDAIRTVINETFDIMSGGEGFLKNIFPWVTVCDYDEDESYAYAEQEMPGKKDVPLSDEDAEKELKDAMDALLASKKEAPWTEEEKQGFCACERVASRGGTSGSFFTMGMAAYGKGTTISDATRERLIGILQQMVQIKNDIKEKGDENIDYTFEACWTLFNVLKHRSQALFKEFMKKENG